MRKLTGRFILITGIIIGALPLAGCGFFSALWGDINGTATPAQAQLVANWVNGTCNLVTTLGATAIAIDTVVQPHAMSGGAGASTQSTILKAQAIGQIGCQLLNGVTATVSTGSNGAVASLPAAVPTVAPGQ